MRWGVPKRKITVVPNGLDVDQMAFDPEARERVRAQFGIAPDTYLIGVARAPRPQQAGGPDHGGGRAATWRALQDPRDRAWRGRGPARSRSERLAWA